MLKPLSESLQKLRRAQRAFVRRKRRSKVRVSFSHSSSSRNSGAKSSSAKRTSRQIKPDDVQISAAPVAPLAATWQDAHIRNSVKQQKDYGPYPPFTHYVVSSSSHEDGHCLGSPSKRRRRHPKVAFEGDARRHSVMRVPDQPYWGTLPKSPIRSPPKYEATSMRQRQELEYSRTDPLQDVERASLARENSIRRRPIPAGQGGARYSVFPKANHQQRTTRTDEQIVPPDLVQSQPVRRSLSQQQRLSALVPVENKPAADQSSSTTKPGCCDSPLIPIAGQDMVSPGEVVIFTAPPRKQTVLSKFAKELKEFAKATAVTGMPQICTPAPTETHASVHTVQEFLPYRQQFQEAGLAVTSADQKAPDRRSVCTRPQHDSSADGRLKFDGSASSQSTQESSTETVVHYLPQEDTSFSIIDQFPQTRSKQKSKRPSRQEDLQRSHAPECQSLAVPAGAENLSATAQDRPTKPRPPAVFLSNNPLPSKPNLPRSTGQYEIQGLANEAHGAQEGTLRSRVRLDSGMEESPRQAPSEEHETTMENSASAFLRIEQVVSANKTNKSLPALPVSRIPSQVRHAMALPSKTGRAPSARQLPATILEEKEPSPEKHRRTDHSPRISAPKTHVTTTEIQNTKNSTIWIAAESGLGSKPELPETWKHAVSTPSSFEKALDDVVRKLKAMEEKKRRKPAAESEKTQARSRRTSSKPLSPSQRLQRAAAMRRQRMADAALHDLESAEKTVLVTPSPHPSQAPPIPILRRVARLAPSDQMNQALPSEAESAASLGDKDINDRDILKGLRIICAASADSELDAWIQSKTGLRLRRFLADLKTFEDLSEDGMAAVDHQRARRRRAERRKLLVE